MLLLITLCHMLLYLLMMFCCLNAVVFSAFHFDTLHQLSTFNYSRHEYTDYEIAEKLWEEMEKGMGIEV